MSCPTLQTDYWPQLLGYISPETYIWLAKQPKNQAEQSRWHPKLDNVWKSICWHSLVPLERSEIHQVKYKQVSLPQESIYPWHYRRLLLARKSKRCSFYLFDRCISLNLFGLIYSVSKRFYISDFTGQYTLISLQKVQRNPFSGTFYNDWQMVSIDVRF